MLALDRLNNLFMKLIKISKGIFILITLTITFSCSDHFENLGSDYFYRDEGGKIKDILCKKAKSGGIPSTVVSFNYNDEFIIAKQKPNLPQDILYDKIYKYKEGTNATYYWLVIKDKYIVLGPYNSREFASARIKYKVDDDLVW